MYCSPSYRFCDLVYDARTRKVIYQWKSLEINDDDTTAPAPERPYPPTVPLSLPERPYGAYLPQIVPLSLPSRPSPRSSLYHSRAVPTVPSHGTDPTRTDLAELFQAPAFGRRLPPLRALMSNQYLQSDSSWYRTAKRSDCASARHSAHWLGSG